MKIQVRRAGFLAWEWRILSDAGFRMEEKGGYVTRWGATMAARRSLRRRQHGRLPRDQWSDVVASASAQVNRCHGGGR